METIVREELDVIVVGAGNAATCAALSARENGARVPMLEIAPEEARDGNSVFTGGADDDDRAAAVMFYYGYLAAKAGIRVIDVSQIDGNVRKVMDQCAAARNITVPQAFRQALGRR